MMRRRPLREATLSILFRALAALSGLVNIVFIPRYLTREFYGLYSFYMSRFITILTSLQSIAKFWTYREEACGLKVARAGLKMSIIISIISYLISLIVLTEIYGVPIHLSFLAAVLGSLYVLYDFLIVLPNVYRPHVSQLAYLILRISQATIIILLVMYKILTIETVFEGVIICYSLTVLFLTLYFKDILKEKGERLLTCLKRWYRKFYVPLIGSLAGLIYGIDALYITYIVGFNYVAGLFLSLSVIYNIYNICGSASSGLTSFLLMTRDIERGKIYTYITLVTAVPSYIFVLFYPWYIISLYGYKYVQYQCVLRCMAVYGCSMIILSLITSLEAGADSTDIASITFNELKKTTIFRMQMLRLITATSYTIMIIPLIYYLHIQGIYPIMIVEAWALAMTLRTVAESIAHYLYVLRRVVPSSQVTRTIVRPFITSLISGFIALLALNWYENSLNISSLFRLRLLELVPLIFEKYIVFIIFAIAICVIVDREFRYIVRTLLRSLSRRGS